MSFINKLIIIIKNIFNKKGEIKKLETHEEIYSQKEKAKFIKSLKINDTEERKKVETLICEGDGLGIQKNISY